MSTLLCFVFLTGFNSEIRNSPLRGSPFAPGVSGAVGGPAGEMFLVA